MAVSIMMRIKNESICKRDIVKAADGTGIHQTIQTREEEPSLETERNETNLLPARARELGYRFGPLRNGVLRQLTRQDQTHRGLDLTG